MFGVSLSYRDSKHRNKTTQFSKDKVGRLSLCLEQFAFRGKYSQPCSGEFGIQLQPSRPSTHLAFIFCPLGSSLILIPGGSLSIEREPWAGLRSRPCLSFHPSRSARHKAGHTVGPQEDLLTGTVTASDSEPRRSWQFLSSPELAAEWRQV